MTLDQPIEAPWPQRSLYFAIGGGLVGFTLYRLMFDSDDAVRFALAAALAVFAVLYAMLVTRADERRSMAFAAGWGAVAGLVTWFSGPGSESGGEGWRMLCAGLSTAIAAPFYQVWRAERARLTALSYPALHDAAWTNVLTLALSFVFAVISIGLVQLLSALFELIGINLLRDLLREDWSVPVILGTAFAGAIGILRDRARLVGNVQRIVTAVLSALAPVLAVGLGLFLLALPFTGLAPLWEATKATTPILLSVMIAALILANGVIGDRAEDEPRWRLLRWGACVLAASVLPLAVLAAVSTGKRIGQYGLTPDRLWAATFIGVALVFGAFYLLSLLRGRAGWSQWLRNANRGLALGLCGLTLFLALPIVSFNAWSTASQIGRLERGEVTAQEFDWKALRFDFGAPGRAALARLTKSGDPQVAKLAREAERSGSPWALEEQAIARRTVIRVLPKPAPLPDALRQTAVTLGNCRDNAPCVVLWQPGDETAVIVSQVCRHCAPSVMSVEARNDWGMPKGSVDRDARDWAMAHDALKRGGRVEIRNVTRRQVFVGGVPVGEALDPAEMPVALKPPAPPASGAGHVDR